MGNSFTNKEPHYPKLTRNCGIEMKVTVLLILIFPSIVFGNYDGYKRNSDGSYVLGGCYDGYKRNPDGSYSVGWKCSK